jgi:hypothetical protein
VNHFVVTLRHDLNALVSRYRIPHGEWEAHLEAIAAMTSHTEGNRSVALSLKTLTASTAVGTVLVGKALTPPLQALGRKVLATSSSKAAAQVATKTGGSAAAKVGGKWFGPLVGMGIMVWDVWDHQATKAENKPLLRRNIADYLHEVRNQLLYDTESGVMSVIYGLEKEILHSLEQKTM